MITIQISDTFSPSLEFEIQNVWNPDNDIVSEIWMTFDFRHFLYFKVFFAWDVIICKKFSATHSKYSVRNLNKYGFQTVGLPPAYRVFLLQTLSEIRMPNCLKTGCWKLAKTGFQTLKMSEIWTGVFLDSRNFHI